MSVEALSWVFNFSKSVLAARHVLLSIANHAKADGTGAWPSVGTIMRQARVSERTVQYSIKNLIKMGELHVVFKAGPHGTNLYTLSKMIRCNISGGRAEIPSGAIYDTHPRNLRSKGVQRVAPDPSLTVKDKEARQTSPHVYPRTIRESKAKAEAMVGAGPGPGGNMKPGIAAKYSRRA